MRVLIHDYGGYPFCLELSRAIASRGHRVQHVFFPAACPSMYNMEPQPNDPETLEIVPLGTDLPYLKYASLFRRRSQEIAYGQRLARHIADWRPDVVLSANTPLDVQNLAIRATHASKARFVLWLQDIISIAMSTILKQCMGPLGAIIAVYYARIEHKVALDSDAIVSITADFLPILQRWGVAATHCHVIENWAPKDDIRPFPKDNSWSRKLNLHDKKVFLYSGRLGLKHDPELLVRLAESYRDDPGVMVVVVADGHGADWLVRKKAEVGLDNLLLLPFQPYSDLPNVLATGDVLVGIIEKSAHLYSVPSKILSYLAAGRTILAAMPESNTNARHITQIGAGRVIPPGESDMFIAAARTLMNEPALRSQCEDNARRYAEATFDIDRIASEFLTILQGET